MRAPKPRLYLPAAVAAAALTVRVAWLHVLGPSQITWDGAEYARTAFNLIHGLGFVGIHGTEQVIFPPLYPLAIAVVMLFGASGENAGIIVSLLAGAALVFPVYAIAARMYGREAGVLAGAVIAFLPVAVDMSAVVLSDMLFAFLAMSGLALLIQTLDDRRPLAALAAGALFGLAYLTRPEGLIIGVAGLAAFAFASLAASGRRSRLPSCAALYAGALIVVAAPYAAHMSARAHGFALEGKSSINATIAARMRDGLDYTEAADAVDAKLNVIGPELDDNGYFADASARRPPLGERISLALSAARRHVIDIPRALASTPFGTPLLLLAAVAGAIAGPWTRRRAVGEAAILCYIAALFLALASVYHFWPRYAIGFAPIVAIWSGRALDLAIGRLRLQVRASSALATAAIALACCALLVHLRGWFAGEVNDSELLTERAAGAWMAQHEAPGRILSVSDQSAYYANGTWSMLPYVPHDELAIAYVRRKAPDYIVLDRFTGDRRPYVIQWLANGIPDARAHLEHIVGDPRHPDAAVYRWDERTARLPLARDAQRSRSWPRE